MELEQRVKSLEYEMKILKNEVQRTLLDIQEQILIHYYPSLRTEESVPTQAVESIRERKRQVGGAPNPPKVKEASGLPGVMQISLEEIKTAQKEPLVSE